MKKHSQLKISLIAVGVGFLFAFLIVILAGRNPLNLLAAIIKSVSGFNILRPNEPVTLVNTLNWLKYAVPITLTGLSVGFAYRTGLFNIGGEGQILAGGTAAAIQIRARAGPQRPHRRTGKGRPQTGRRPQPADRQTGTLRLQRR